MNEDPRPGGCIAQQMVAMPEMYEVSPERVVDHLRLAPIDPPNCTTPWRHPCSLRPQALSEEASTPTGFLFGGFWRPGAIRLPPGSSAFCSPRKRLTAFALSLSDTSKLAQAGERLERSIAFCQQMVGGPEAAVKGYFFLEGFFFKGL